MGASSRVSAHIYGVIKVPLLDVRQQVNGPVWTKRKCQVLAIVASVLGVGDVATDGESLVSTFIIHVRESNLMKIIRAAHAGGCFADLLHRGQ